MTKEQLAGVLAALGVTQTELAKRLDISARTMRRYVAGDVPIPHVVGLALDYLHFLGMRPAPAAAGPVYTGPTPDLAPDPPPRPPDPAPILPALDRYAVRSKRDGFRVFDVHLGRFAETESYPTRQGAERRVEQLNARARFNRGGKFPPSRRRK